MIRIGIVGYGNLGQGVEKAVEYQDDIALVAIFTRRDPKSIKTNKENVKVESLDNILQYRNLIDVMILCGGSANDLVEQTPIITQHFHVIDSYDNHDLINIHFDKVDESAKLHEKVAIVSVGWDPGLFSLIRLYNKAILPHANIHTFWGKGVSQGHSEAIRRIAGVKYAVQYTIPIQDAIDRVRLENHEKMTPREKHYRDCFVVIKDGYNQEEIRAKIVNMPYYFAPYHTNVTFISEEEFLSNHNKMPHGGNIITVGQTSQNCKASIEYSLKLDSNPEFTSFVLLAFTRAVMQLANNKNYGAKTIFDIPPIYLIRGNAVANRKELL